MYWNQYRILLKFLRDKLFFKKFFKYLLLNYIFATTELTYKIKTIGIIQFKNLFYKTKKSNTNSICLLSGRAKAINQKFLLSRFMLRFQTNKGNIGTLSRKSW